LFRSAERSSAARLGFYAAFPDHRLTASADFYVFAHRGEEYDKHKTPELQAAAPHGEGRDPLTLYGLMAYVLMGRVTHCSRSALRPRFPGSLGDTPDRWGQHG